MLAILAAGAAVGVLVLEASDHEIAAAVSGGVVSWGGVFVARRVLARLGHRSFDELPSADWEEQESAFRDAWIELVASFSYFGSVGAIYLATDALGGEAGQEWVAFVVAFPVWFEVDARLGVWARRNRTERAERVRSAARGAHAPPDSDDIVPLRRARAVWIAASCALAAPGMLAFGLLGEDMSAFARICVLACAPALAWAAIRTARMARAPYFLRADARGADLLGAGPVPWEEILYVDVTAVLRQRWLELVLDDVDRARAAPWFERGHKRLLHAGSLRAQLMLAADSPEDVVALIRAHHDVDVEVDFGEEDLGEPA